ncbi:hypothetical protein ONZ45_g4448 [Pleurotus djamor]|nr:hypothetical protein ONZ45_g4448 [Pleurotus djamor]
MTPTTTAQMLPVIDINPFVSSSSPESRNAVAAALHKACVEYGFFYLDISSYVDPSEPEELTTLARQFFHSPQEEKDKISLSKNDHARGYARLKENVTNGKADNHEGIDLYRPVENPDKSKPLWGENLWPSIPGFREKYEKWVEKMKVLGLIVMEAFLYADPTPNALQVFLPQIAKATSASSVTAGLPSEEGGVNGVWITADPLPGCVVCNIGEMWEIWTNGLYRSTLHHVHRPNPAHSPRVSIPFFFEPNFDAHIEPLPAAKRFQEKERASNGSSKEYAPIVYGNFLMGKVTNNFAGGSKYD